MDIETILHQELIGSLDFFQHHTNLDSDSKGFGLTVDSTKNKHIASIASVGFALTAWVIAAERGCLPHKSAMDITKRSLHTLLHHAAHHRGFFAHFLQMDNAERVRKCEYSTIDTAICLNGVITAAAYFEDAEICDLAQQLLERVDWHFIIFEKDDKTLFRMAYNPDQDGDYVTEAPGFIHQWDMAAEQKMMYLQAAVHLDPALAQKLYQGFSRDVGRYDGEEIIINPGGHLFAYQFSEAWLDTAHYLDPDGLDWFNNTRLASLANRSFCIENAATFPTYHAKSWGISCGDSPWGYDVSGSTPSLQKPNPHGTISIFAALACLPFAPEPTLEMIDYVYHQHPQIWGQYGFFESYNLAVSPPWYSHSIYGIHKGCSMIMIENYFSRLVWETYTNNPNIQKALTNLGFTRRQGKEAQNEQILRKRRSLLAQ